MEDTQLPDGVRLLTDDDNNKILLLQGPWQSSYKSLFSSLDIIGIRLSFAAGWKDRDLSFLRDLCFLRSVEVYNWYVTDITPISVLTSIQKIGLSCNYKTCIDFSKFPHLHSCYIKWRPKSESIFDTIPLIHLNIENYPYIDVTPLKQLKNLRTLKLSSTNLLSLTGIKSLIALESIDLLKCIKLTSLDAIETAKHLKSFEVDGCRKITSIFPLSKLYDLRRIVVNDCLEIDSIQPLQSLRKLEELYFVGDTTIRDGDLTIFERVASIRKMSFSERRHYSHKKIEVQRIINERST